MTQAHTFLSTVLPSVGTRITTFLGAIDASGDRRKSQNEFQPLDAAALVKYGDWAMRQGMDVYVAIAGYGAKQRPISAGPRAGQLVTSRTADNAMYHRCLRIDIDVSSDPAKSPYASKGAAWAGLKAFIQGAGMPLPMIVDSGYGLHCYWPFTTDVPLERWMALSSRLAAAMAAHQLAVDTTATEDAARILRLPGTQNFKNGLAVPVTVAHDGSGPEPVEVYEGLLAGYQTTVLAGVAGSMPNVLRQGVSDLEAGLHPTYSMRGVLTICPGLSAMLANNGATTREPVWHAALAVVNRAGDDDATKAKVARALSVGHAGFNEGEFSTKWAQVQGQNYEPPSCAKFAQLGMPECATCPFGATHKSPVVFGRPQPTMAPSQAAIAPAFTPIAPPSSPSPMALMPQVTPVAAPPMQQGVFQWYVGDPITHIVDGTLAGNLVMRSNVPCLLEKPDDGTDEAKSWIAVPVGKYQWVSFERLLDARGEQSLMAMTFNRHADGYARIELSHRELHDTRAFASLLSAAGVYYTPKDMKTIVERFMPEFLTQLQAVRQASAIASRCGWTDDFSQFVLGTAVYDAKGLQHVRPGAAIAEMEAYHTSGNESDWRAAFDLCLSSDAERQAVLALGIAAPLMAFTGVDGVLLNAWSPESGVGKSTLCDAVLSIWGNPRKLRKDFRDTPAATFHLAGVSGNMPMVVDEFTNVEGKNLSDYVYTITQGRERHRMSSDAKVRSNNNRWCLAAIATSNSSVHQKLQAYRSDAVAEAARVFELRIHPAKIDPALMGSAKRTLAALNDNYGFLGPRLVQLFMQKGAAFWRNMVTSRIAWWDQHMAHDTGDRFRSVVAALVEIGAQLGSTFGYAFDTAKIVNALQVSWRQQMADFDASRTQPRDFITDYIAQNLPRMALYVDGMERALTNDFVGEIRGTGKTQATMTVTDVLLPAKLLRDYIEGRNGNYRAVLEWMHKELATGGVVVEDGNLTFLKGSMRSMRIQGFRFNASVMGVTSVVVPPASGSNVTPITAANGGTP